jgi:hypothetical protein
VLDLWRIHQAQKAAVQTIRPFVEGSRWRFGGIPESVWLEPYIVGFLGTLITLAALSRVPGLRSGALASVQTGAWGQITQMTPDLIGEEICFLSAGSNKSFEAGCRNATQFFESLSGLPDRTALLASQSAAHGLDSELASDEEEIERYMDEEQLWTAYFEPSLRRAYDSAGGDPSALAPRP